MRKASKSEFYVLVLGSDNITVSMAGWLPIFVEHVHLLELNGRVENIKIVLD